LYDLQTTNLADIYPPPDAVNFDIPEEEPECDHHGADHYTHPVMEAPMEYPPSLNCYDGHQATSEKTFTKILKVSAPAAQGRTSEVSICHHTCDIALAS
jgi:hypothetical protein